MAALAFTPQPIPEPMVDLNTTPLIDVMLVLIIMLIITIPSQTHSVSLDLPTGPPLKNPPLLDRNKVVITEAGALLFNGRPVDRAELRALLDATGQLAQEPELQLQPAALAPYGAVDEVLVAVRQAHLNRVGFVGNENYARF
jgi:biopolymer transport protein ExbD